MKLTLKESLKKATILAITIGIMGLCGCGGKGYEFDITTEKDFRNSNIGDTIEAVKGAENITVPQETEFNDYWILSYDNVTVDGIDAKIMYTFDRDDKLQNGVVYYHETGENDEVFKALAEK